MPTPFTEAQQMLCLAALTYREFADVGPPALHEQQVHDDIAAKLRSIPVLGGEWALVWGPATYKAPLSLFDSSAMFVVKHTRDADRYVVAVRGTNPVSAFDWLFGDVWVAGQMAWPFDATGKAQISLSTALGLDTLLQLRSRPGAGGPSGRVVDDALRRFGSFADTLKQRLVQPLQHVDVEPIRKDIAVLLTQIAAQRVALRGRDAAVKAESLTTQWSSPARSAVIAQVANALGHLGGGPSLHVLALVERDTRIVSRLAGGLDLLTFLTAAVADARGDVDVVVTGHSKGGALAPALALWLAEMQGTATDSWAPKERASVRCYGFAGPTPGNEAFAHRFNRTVDRSTRIHNARDIVPKAWVPDDVRRIPTLYNPDVPAVPHLDELAGTITDVLKAQHLGYAHVGTQVEELPGRIERGIPDFVGQMIHQHLQGYFDGMDLGHLLDVDTFFNPLR